MSRVAELFAKVGMIGWDVQQNQPDEQLRGRMLPDKWNLNQPSRFGQQFVSLYPNQSPRDHHIMARMPYLLFRANPKVNPPQYLPATATPTPQRSAIQLQQNYLSPPDTSSGGGVGAFLPGPEAVNMLG